jgi:hypothetical protein
MIVSYWRGGRAVRQCFAKATSPSWSAGDICQRHSRPPGVQHLFGFSELNLDIEALRVEM